LTGTVQSAQEITVSPQVSGQVTFLDPRLQGGGFFKAGEKLFEIESIDYQLALEKSRANLAKNELELNSVESKARVAKREWEMLKKDRDDPPSPLVLYEPQLKEAEANLAAARAAVSQAELDLARTAVVAPFDCVVLSESLGPGQYLRAGNSVAVLADSTMAEVVVPVPLPELAWLEVPRPGSRAEGSPAEVRLSGGNPATTWEGKIDRTLAEVDPQGRMARLVVRIDDPYLQHHPRQPGQPDLSIGSFVEVKFRGRTLKDVVVIPRQALRQGDTVWLMDDNQLLRVQRVEPLRLEEKTVVVGSGLKEGDRVVLTNLSGASDGMKLRPATPGEATS
ncbi:MAG TPA: efflux RND transporter periplasmic adaptor subunit, partial [Pseudodesulfovibrio sp.]|nr:efflux RND transporter periplasmic adaptor subunit [Pseudodesulfovibrio sp.]